jgi:hypothetical protein
LVITIAGWDYPADAQAHVFLNSVQPTDPEYIQVDEFGSFIFFLDTTGAEAGAYEITVTVNPSASDWFVLSDSGQVMPQDGGGLLIYWPSRMPPTSYFIYLPIGIKE